MKLLNQIKNLARDIFSKKVYEADGEFHVEIKIRTQDQITTIRDHGFLIRSATIGDRVVLNYGCDDVSTLIGYSEMVAQLALYKPCADRWPNAGLADYTLGSWGQCFDRVRDAVSDVVSGSEGVVTEVMCEPILLFVNPEWSISGFSRMHKCLTALGKTRAAKKLVALELQRIDEVEEQILALLRAASVSGMSVPNVYTDEERKRMNRQK